jgi:hypothetical protein
MRIQRYVLKSSQYVVAVRTILRVRRKAGSDAFKPQWSNRWSEDGSSIGSERGKREKDQETSETKAKVESCPS